MRRSARSRQLRRGGSRLADVTCDLADAIQVRDPDNRPLELKSLEQGVVAVE